MKVFANMECVRGVRDKAAGESGGLEDDLYTQHNGS